MIERIIEICIWPIVILICIVILRTPLSKFIILLGEGLKIILTSIANITISKTKNGTKVAIDTISSKQSLKTYPAQISPEQIQDTSKKEKFEMLEMLLKKGEPVKVGEICKKWQKEDPEDIRPYLFQGRAYLEQGKFELAEKEFSKVLKINDKDSQIYYYLAKIPFAKEDFANAKSLLEKAFELDDEDPKVNLALAFVAYYREKNIDKSLKFAEVAHESYKKRGYFLPLGESLDFDIHQSLQYYLAERGRQKDFERAFEIDNYLEQIIDDYLNKGWINKRQLGLSLDTRGYLRYKAIRENYKPENNDIFIKISIDFFAKALELVPTDRDIALNLVEAIKLSNIMQQKKEK